MLIALTLFLIVLGVFLHEYGHLRAMFRYGVEVEKITVGIPIKYLSICIQNKKLFRGVPLYLSPLLLAGYVKMKNPEKDLPRLHYTHHLDINGGGLVMNIVFSCLILSITRDNFYHFVLCVGIASITLLLEKVLARYVFPLLSFSLLIFLPGLLWSMAKSMTTVGGDTSVAITEAAGTVVGYKEALNMAAYITILLAIANLLPLSILDGGQSVKIYLEKWLPAKIVRVYSSIVTVTTLLVLFASLIDSIFAIGRIGWGMIIK